MEPPTPSLPPVLDTLLDGDERAALARLDRLSNQERAVFVLLGRGLRAKVIAGELAISPKTVETHLARIRAKLAPEDAMPVDLADLAFLARLWVRAVDARLSGKS